MLLYRGSELALGREKRYDEPDATTLMGRLRRVAGADQRRGAWNQVEERLHGEKCR